MIKQLGEYKLIKELGSGGNADVFVAKNAKGKEVAVKIFREEKVKGKKAIKRKKRFECEIKTVVQIQDEIEGIIPILSYGLPDIKTKKYWYAMPIAIPLEEKLQEVKSLEDRVNCVLELAITLKRLHEKGIVHRDIKPKNIYFYNGKYCLGDFGLVDYPDKKDLTSLQEAVGPKTTMAPEMKYNTKKADAKKADVYSLAKTFWIVLIGKMHGFEGRYEEEDAKIGLRNDKRYKKEHLVELEVLLKCATEYDPSQRPTMEVFVQTLEKWLDVASNIQKRNYSEWEHLQNKLFPKTLPLHAEWSDLDSIIEILNNVGSLPGLNHMFLPNGGGMDIESARQAAEKECICVVAGSCNYILKPRKLELENYGNRDYMWSYFRLELEALESISGSVYEECCESVIEDFPGHYVESKLKNYERYDDGTEFPKDYKIVKRMLAGTIVIFPKQSIYNHISGTYDARHNKMSSIQFRHYMKTMRRDYYRINNFQKFLNIYQKNPFEVKKENGETEIDKSVEESRRFNKFIEENWKQWCFKDICDKNNTEKDGKLEFAIMFRLNGELFAKSKYVTSTGYLAEEDSFSYLVSKDRKYLFSNFNGVIKTIDGIKNHIKKLCGESGIVWQEINICFSIELFRIKPPVHIFTENEIREVLRAGNDFRNNRLVIDEDGYVRLIEGGLYYELYQYPVAQETYCAGNNYVGQYANLDNLNEVYLGLLDGWLQHLQTGRRYDIDCYEYDENAEKMIEKIKKYYQ